MVVTSAKAPPTTAAILFIAVPFCRPDSVRVAHVSYRLRT